MPTKLSELVAELSTGDRREVNRRARAHIKAMTDARNLEEIRRAADRKQGEVAAGMGIGQNAVSQLEKRRDLQLSTLSRYVESMGFRLEIAVVAPNGERVPLKNFRPWDESPDANAPGARSGTQRRAAVSKGAPQAARKR
jgi:hypothetical protein